MKVEFWVSRKKEVNVTNFVCDSFPLHAIPLIVKTLQYTPMTSNRTLISELRFLLKHVNKKTQRSGFYKLLRSIMSPLHLVSHYIQWILHFPQTISLQIAQSHSIAQFHRSHQTLQNTYWDLSVSTIRAGLWRRRNAR